MNLPDLVRRKDRAVEWRSGSGEAMNVGEATRRMRGVVLAPGTVLHLKDAHDYHHLRDFPTDIHWWLTAGEGVRILARPHSPALEPALLVDARQGGIGTQQPLLLRWPLWTITNGFDLVIETVGDQPVTITVGPLLDPRAKMAPLLTGQGLELGPGLTPRVIPKPGLDVEYVEEKTPDEWQAAYVHGVASTAALTPDVLERYRIGSAVTLAQWPAASLDFIFSNHVLEHLHNPMQVLRNWLSRLRPGGSVLAVIPDTRFTFDLRQGVSTVTEILDEEKAGGHEIGDEKYHRWCRYTAPYNTIENLKLRNYSIHVHFYTPALIRDIADILISRGDCRGVFIDAVSNNKEFGIVLQR